MSSYYYYYYHYFHLFYFICSVFVVVISCAWMRDFSNASVRIKILALL